MRRRTIILGAGACLLLAGAAAFVFVRGFQWTSSPWAEGTPVASFEGVQVYDNGPLFSVSHGRHYAADGYYFGQKWQCVEFIKRFLYQAKGHRMPDVMGHAVSFYDPEIGQGAINPKRAMLQFAQGGAEPPAIGDLIVFGGAAGYGHVGIVSGRGDDFIEVVQQNKPPAQERLPLTRGAAGYTVGGGLPTLGWLRVPPAGG